MVVRRVSVGLDGCEVRLTVIRVPVCARVSRVCPGTPGVFSPAAAIRHHPIRLTPYGRSPPSAAVGSLSAERRGCSQSSRLGCCVLNREQDHESHCAKKANHQDARGELDFTAVTTEEPTCDARSGVVVFLKSVSSSSRPARPYTIHKLNKQYDVTRGTLSCGGMQPKRLEGTHDARRVSAAYSC